MSPAAITAVAVQDLYPYMAQVPRLLGHLTALLVAHGLGFAPFGPPPVFLLVQGRTGAVSVSDAGSCARSAGHGPADQPATTFEVLR